MSSPQNPSYAKRVYISGPMTGYPGYNLVAFENAAHHLEEYGHVAINPGRHGSGQTWDYYMRLAVKDVADADAVVILPGWECSRGAVLEVSIAHALGLPVVPLAVFLPQCEVCDINPCRCGDEPKEPSY